MLRNFSLVELVDSLQNKESIDQRIMEVMEVVTKRFSDLPATEDKHIEEWMAYRK